MCFHSAYIECKVCIKYIELTVTVQQGNALVLGSIVWGWFTSGQVRCLHRETLRDFSQPSHTLFTHLQETQKCSLPYYQTIEQPISSVCKIPDPILNTPWWVVHFFSDLIISLHSFSVCKDSGTTNYNYIIIWSCIAQWQSSHLEFWTLQLLLEFTLFFYLLLLSAFVKCLPSIFNYVALCLVLSLSKNNETISLSVRHDSFFHCLSGQRPLQEQKNCFQYQT